ncbi:9570_t:CDS:1, partial [Dentiscutata erythropus]
VYEVFGPKKTAFITTPRMTNDNSENLEKALHKYQSHHKSRQTVKATPQ